MYKQDNRLRHVIVVFIALIAMMAPALAAEAAGSGSAGTSARVHGNGSGVLIDPDGNSFPLRSYQVRGVVTNDGSATGEILLLWRGAFPRVWGDPACEGTCDTVILNGEVQSGSVAADGTVTLSGTAREVDQRRGRVIHDTGFVEPFSIVVGGSQPKNSFVLQWCELPEFVIKGHIRANTYGDHVDGRSLTSSQSLRAACDQRGVGV